MMMYSMEVLSQIISQKSYINYLIKLAKVKGRMKHEQKPFEKCQLCRPRSRQQRIINKMLLRQLLKVKQVKPSFWIEFPPDLNRQPLQALHKVLGTLRTTKKIKESQCTHGLWLRTLQKTGYNMAQACSLCDYVISRQAERAYQLWLLQSQIKNIAENIGNSQETLFQAKKEDFILPAKLKNDNTFVKQEQQQENPFKPFGANNDEVDQVVKTEEACVEQDAIERSSLMTNYCVPWAGYGMPFPDFFATHFM